MPIKSKAILFRNFLYLNEVIKASRISVAAEKNGIKASNLSKIITDMEELTQKKLFIRTNKGLIPTKEALTFSEIISNIENSFDNQAQKLLNTQIKDTISLYVPENIEIKNLHLFNETTILFCNNKETADVFVSYTQPENNDELITVNNTIGKDFKQTIWVCSINQPQAINLARFIICQMHLE